MKLKKFMLVTELATFLLPLCIIALAAFYITTDSLQQDATRKNTLIARATANQLEKALQNPRMMLQQAHESHAVARQQAEGFYLNPLLRIEPLFQRIEVLNKQGIVREVVPLDAQMQGIDRSSQAFFQALRSGKPEYWSNAFISLPQGIPSVVLAVAFDDHDMAAHLNLTSLHQLIDSMQERYDPGLDIAVVDQSGVFISHHDSQRVMQRQTLDNFLQVKELVAAGNGAQGWEDKKNRQLLSFAKVETTGWYVIVTQSAESAFATINKLRNLFLWIVLFSLTGAIVASRYKTGFVVRSFAKVEAALIQARDDLEVKVELRTQELSAANQELTSVNEEMAAINEELHNLNNALGQEITIRQQAETELRQAKEILAETVEERTYELFTANQELHQSVRKLEAEIAVRKQVEKSLDETEERYRAVIEQSPEAVLLCDPDTGDILEANSRFAERFGYDRQLQGKMNLFDLNSGESDTIRFILDLVKSSGFLPARRYAVNHRNGTLVDVELAATLVRYQGRLAIMLTFRDVTDIVRREQQSLSDAQLATRVQTALLSMPASSDFVLINTIYQPFGYVGGDLYFLDWRYGGLLLRGFLIDVAGHGLSTSLHTASLHVLLREVNERDLPLSDAMRWINRRVGDYFDEATFAGAIGFELDLETRQLRWSCAGLPEVWMASQTLTGVVAKPGLFLGILPDETFETHEIPIAVGDSFYFMTDGLTDLLDRQNGPELDRYSAMVQRLRRMAEAPDRHDDATAVCIHVSALPQSSVRQDGWPKSLRFNGYGDYQRMKGEVAKILAEVTGQPHSIQEVAVHEALANAMECRDGVPRQNQASIRFNKIGGRLIIRVKTSRMGFAGNAVLRRFRSHPEEMFAFGEDASMGRGIPIMLSLTDQMIYNSEGTELLLAWKL